MVPGHASSADRMTIRFAGSLWQGGHGMCRNMLPRL
jgi:hypothetical protein